MIRLSVFRLSALFALALTGACSPIVVNHGHLVDQDSLAAVKVGQSRMEDVNGLLGSPTEVGTFDDTVWYYISQTTEKTAFLAPEVTSQRIVIVHFDPKGVVSAVNVADGVDAMRDIEMVDRTTPTSGRELTFMEQLLGNVGRFGTKDKQVGVMRTPGGM